MASARRYLYVGVIILSVSGAIAIYLNFQGVRCLSDLALVDRSVLAPTQLEEMERNCSIVTNSYVYSVYGVVAGIMLVVIGFMRKRKGNVS
ncbi:MAG: hypothetical protein QXX64_03415 [Nitrososphaera sp.]|uniref:Uncharacterized protein n=1 Tax=Nitrososphaera gargensis (strain Ga9.2) TaxID=1237085 RepID=K0IAL6_NITGG|nr:hypothetical protein [Candidatus Nitrososphaera gargensis]AFU58366.1 hypothetical protein Ngar_c14300 [Candidatus Nitrososphaera gargensis Ga9.2]